MANEDHMPKIDVERDGYRLTSLQKEYMQRIHEQNKDRVQKWSKIRRNNRFLGVSLSIGVISIYSYTMWAIKQESFLDDFNEPEKVNN